MHTDVKLARALATDDFLPGQIARRGGGLRVLAICLALEHYGSSQTTDAGQWSSVAIALNEPRWSDLRLCVIRLYSSERLYSTRKRALRASFENLCRDTKLRVCVDGESCLIPSTVFFFLMVCSDRDDREVVPGEDNDFRDLI